MQQYPATVSCIPSANGVLGRYPKSVWAFSFRHILHARQIFRTFSRLNSDEVPVLPPSLDGCNEVDNRIVNEHAAQLGRGAVCTMRQTPYRSIS